MLACMLGSNSSSTPGTWDFGAGDTAAGLTITAQGGSGASAVSGGRLTLAPQQNVSNSMAALAPGAYLTAALTFKTTPRSGEVAAYPAVSIGAGPIRDLGGDGASWWFTCLRNCYMLGIGADRRLLLCRADGASDLVVVYQSGVAAEDFWDSEHVLELIVGGGNVEVKLDGVSRFNTSGAIYGAGNVLVAQGAYSGGNGGSMAVRKIVCT